MNARAKEMWVSAEILKNVLRGRACAGCGSLRINAGFVCLKCWAPLEHQWSRPYFAKTKFAQGLELSAFFQWFPGQSDLLSTLIHRYKGHNHRAEWNWVATRWRQAQRINLAALSGAAKQIVFVPAPSGRGRDHAFEFAQALAQIYAAPLVDCLRIHRPRTQRGLNRRQRRRRQVRLTEDFTVDFFEDKAVILVDDVVTTGATIFACQQALAQTELEVWCLAYRRSQQDRSHT